MESAGNPTGGDLYKLRYTHDLGLAIYLVLGDKLTSQEKQDLAAFTRAL